MLEKGTGLNLTWEVRDGIKKHTGSEIPYALEGQIIRFADRVAYINHDIEDAIRAKILSPDSLPYECVNLLGKSSSKRINSMIVNIIENSRDNNSIQMSLEHQQAMNELRDFLFKNVYIDSFAKKDETKAQNIIKELYIIFKMNPTLLPEELYSMLKDNDIDRIVCDYIAGMTDRYVVKRFQQMFIPESCI